MTNRRLIILLGSILAAGLVVVGVIVVVGAVDRAGADERHRSAVAHCEEQYAAPYGDDFDAFTSCLAERTR